MIYIVFVAILKINPAITLYTFKFQAKSLMDLKESLEEIRKLWHQLKLPLRQGLAYIYLEKEKEIIGEIGEKLEDLYENKEFRLFLRKLHREYKLNEALELRRIFTKKRLFKENPLQWYTEAKNKLDLFFGHILKDANAFEAYEKNLHESLLMKNEPSDKINQIFTQRLANGEHVKAAIIGAGFSGLSAAYFLLMSGKYNPHDIVLLEKKFVGSGASGRAAGFLTASTEHDFIDMVELYGKEKALRYWQASEEGIEIIAGIVGRIGGDTGYFEKNGYLYLATDDESLETLKEESEAQNSVGRNTSILAKEQLAERFNLHGFEGALYSDSAHFVNGAAIINNLSSFLEKNRVRIVENTEVLKIDKRKNILSLSNGIKISADKIIVASNYDTARLGFLKRKLFPVETYLALTEPVPAEFLRKHRMMYYTLMWDTDEIYTYFRILKNGSILIGGSDIDVKERHELKPKMEFMHHFYNYLVAHFPQLKGIRFQHQWSGVLSGSSDLFPFIGQVKGTNVYISVSNGIPYCFLSGKIIADLMFKGRSEYADLFALDRKMPKKAVSIALALGPGVFKRIAKPAMGILRKFPFLKRKVL